MKAKMAQRSGVFYRAIYAMLPCQTNLENDGQQSERKKKEEDMFWVKI